LPSILFMKQCINYETVVFEQLANYQRSSYFNRAYIAGANGKQRLSIPLKGGSRQKKMINEIAIDNTVKWQRIHWQSILSAYAKSAYFEYYEPELKLLYQQPIDNLFDWNINLIKLLFKLLNSTLKHSFTKNYVTKFKVKDEVLDWRNTIRPNMSLAAIEFAPYYQLFQEKNGFIFNLSVLDVLFSEGPNALAKIKSTKYNNISTT